MGWTSGTYGENISTYGVLNRETEGKRILGTTRNKRGG